MIPSVSNTTEYDTYYDTAIQKNILTEKQKSPEAIVTRQDAAKLIVRAMGMGYLAEVGNIYKLTFKDAEKIVNQYKGYAAIAEGLKIMSPISGNFSGTTQLTRGQSASLIINYLKVDVTK